MSTKPGRNDRCPCGSGQKYKTCCAQKLAEISAATGVPAGQVIFYAPAGVLPLFSFVMKHLPEAIKMANSTIEEIYSPSSGLYVHRPFQSGDQARSTILEWMTRVEQALEKVAQRRSTFYWLNLLRRIGIHDLFGFGDQHGSAVQKVAELAAVKFGLSGMPEACPKATAKQDEVMNQIGRNCTTVGHLRRLKGSLEPTVSITDEDVYDYVLLCRLAFEHGVLQVRFREVDTGGGILNAGDLTWEVVVSEEHRSLINLHYQRLESSQEWLATAGLPFDASTQVINKNGKPEPAIFVLTPVNTDSVLLRPWTRILDRYPFLIPTVLVRYRPQYWNLRELEASISPIRRDFQRTYGMPWEAFACFLTGFSMYAMEFYMADPGIVPVRMADFVVKGYMMGFMDDILVGPLDQLALKARDWFYPDFSPRPEEWQAYRERFLTVATMRGSNADLASGQPHSFIVPFGEQCLIDYASIPRFVAAIIRVPIMDSEKDTKATHVEELIQQFISRETGVEPCFPPKKLFWVKDERKKRRVGEADLSFSVGSVYIPIDVKAYTLNVHPQRVSTPRNRWKTAIGWVTQANHLATALRQYPQGTNYDLKKSGFTHVLPIVCSVYPEYIGDRNSSYFLTGDIPRIATPAEVARFLKSASERMLKNHPCVECLE